MLAIPVTLQNKKVKKRFQKGNKAGDKLTTI